MRPLISFAIPLVLAGACGCPIAAAAQAASQDFAYDSNVVWSFREDPRFVAPAFVLGDTAMQTILLVSVREALKAVDGRTGTVLWGRGDLKQVGTDGILPLPGRGTAPSSCP